MPEITIHCKYDELCDPKLLVDHPDNPNQHSKEAIDNLCELILFYGIRKPITVDKERGVIATGHRRKLAAIKLGIKNYPVEYQSFDSEEILYGYVVADNASDDWSELDYAKINEKLPDLGPDFNLEMLGIKDFVLDMSEKGGLTDEDSVPETPAIPNTKLGDLFLLGEHRLLCGDSTDRTQVERLMNGEKADMVFTDPPYGMNLDTNYDNMYAFGDHTHTGNRFKKIEGDAKKYDPSPILAIDSKRKFIWGCDYFYENLPPGGCFVAWDKRTENLDRVPGNTTEFCWAYPPVRRTSARILWSGHFGMNGDDSGKRIHPTQKPIKLIEWFLDHWGKDIGNVVDIYLGSGSTLITCEKTNRKCYGMEIDPHYCDVIIQRWEKFTGKKAQKEPNDAT